MLSRVMIKVNKSSNLKNLEIYKLITDKQYELDNNRGSLQTFTRLWHKYLNSLNRDYSTCWKLLDQKGVQTIQVVSFSLS